MTPNSANLPHWMKASAQNNIHLSSAFTDAELTALVQEIIDSGELGRSRIYPSLLRYLVEASKNRKRVKEIEIALDVLGKTPEFDISRNSAVRVCVHQLRKKLDNYYAKHDSQEAYRLVIPAGRYWVEAVSSDDLDSPIQDRPTGLAAFMQGERPLLIAVALLLLANLAYLVLQANSAINEPLEAAASSQSFWDELLRDDVPILLVMGEYYMFEDTHTTGDIQRLTQTFNNASLTSMDDFRLSDVLTTENYLDLDLRYMPEGSAYTLASIVPILQKENKRVNITMMNDLSDADLESNHIVYIGYIGALDKLSNIMFAASGLQIGRSHDELVNLETQEIYTSDEFLPLDDQPFHDYGLFSTFTTVHNHRIVIAAGMRDAGLMQVGQVLSNQQELGYIAYSLAEDNRAASNFEALYEVFGTDTMNFNARLVYSEALEPDKLWRRGITGVPKEGIGNNYSTAQ